MDLIGTGLQVVDPELLLLDAVHHRGEGSAVRSQLLDLLVGEDPGARRDIEEIVAACQGQVKAIGNKREQKAQAADERSGGTAFGTQ